ncbi:hypothetical protein [Paenibacillus polymyxa]|uniref:hypothetical protein n=1 Tax=Paenibacillus polymyxa TaxID=1406 RepID=UPI003D2ADDEA
MKLLGPQSNLLKSKNPLYERGSGDGYEVKLMQLNEKAALPTKKRRYRRKHHSTRSPYHL